MPAVQSSAQQSQSNPDVLNQIDHIVVLMMENRSFDQMLGFLSLEGGRSDVDGLRPEMANDLSGMSYPIHHEPNTAQPLDPDHTGEAVDEQLSNNNGGFVSNFVRHLGGNAQALKDHWGVVMGYHNAPDLPTHDFLAREFTVCDRWFSSVPGSTWPNRLYAMTGGSDGERENRHPPIYNRTSFVRHLDACGVSWRWYFHDVPLLPTYDWSYVPYATRLRRYEHFVASAARGTLPSVSWIDPNWYAAIGPLDTVSNDDHPPSNIMMGQALVHSVVAALAASPKWNKTLLIVVYDEHGGFFDHVQPPACADDRPDMRRYGARVPAFLVSPLARRGFASHDVFDHTSITKTILNRFCRDANGGIPNMGARVAAANDVSVALQPAGTRELLSDHRVDTAASKVAAWNSQVAARSQARSLVLASALPNQMHSFQLDVIAAKHALGERGLIGKNSKPRSARKRA